MVREAGADASATEGAADIDVETVVERQRAKPSDADDSILSHGEHQSIRARLGFYRSEPEALPILSFGVSHRLKVHNQPLPLRNYTLPK